MKCEKDEVGDYIETTAATIQEVNPYTGNTISLLIQDETAKYIPAFCMFALIGDKCGFKNRLKLPSEKLRKFGDFAVVVTDVKAFLNRLAANSDYESSIVKYIDFFNPPLEDGTAVFNPVVKKHIHFKHQSEFRIYSKRIRVTNEKDLTEYHGDKFISQDFTRLKLDNLSSITTEILSTDDLLRGVRGIKLAPSSEVAEIRNNDLTTKESYARNSQ